MDAEIAFLSGGSGDIQALKLALLVKIEVRDFNRRVLESTETEVLSSIKMKPFSQKEVISIDLENYHEIVDAAKNEFKL